MTATSTTTPRTGTAARGRSRTPQPPAASGQPRSVAVAGLVAAVHAAGLGLLAVTVLVLVGWATAADSGASAGEAVRAALQVWLVGQGTPVAVPGGSFSLVPLGLSVLPAVLLQLATARAARAARLDSLRGAASLTAVVAGVYAVLSSLLALVASTDDIHPMRVRAFLATGFLAALCGGAGAVRGTGCWPGLLRRVPSACRLAAAGGGVALVVLLVGGALLAAVSLAANAGAAADLMGGLQAGAFGGLLLFLLCAVYVPTAVVWAAAYAAGTGFAVGAGTSVTPWEAELGAAPAFPLLAALPGAGGGTTSPLALLVLALPVTAGILGAVFAWRHDRSTTERVLTGWRATVGVGAGAGAVAGAAFAFLAAVTSGAAGPARMAEAGPPWWTGLAVAAEIALVASAALSVLWRISPGDDG